jgi:2-oxoisovalerate dehydrogenase E2 component (dihydrolipoyl transacylase)
MGSIGGTYLSPVILAPQTAIVALGKIQRLPRFGKDSDEVVSRSLMTASWAGDHRILDGATMARFVNSWKGYLENPDTMLAHLK